MRFRLLHLLVVFAIVAIGLFSLDQYVYDTATVKLSSLSVVDQELKTAAFNHVVPPIDKNANYQVEFEIRNAQHSVIGCAFGKYGYNRLLATELTESSLSQFEPRTIKVRFRRRALPWVPETRVVDELNEHFLSVWAFPDPNVIEDR